MRHRIAGRKLGRSTEHRVAMLRNLSSALFEHEKIRTTLAKAKELRPFAEKLVTLSKKETLHARRQVLRHIQNRSVVSKLFDTLSARYAARPGGYTRIIKLGPRRGDSAEMAIIELVDAEEAPEATPAPKAKRGRAKPKAGESSKKKVAAKKAPAKEKGATRKKATKKKAAPSRKSAKTSTQRRTQPRKSG